jgi:hypothetical protein
VTPRPTKEEIRAAQEAGIADVEAQLAAGRPTILVEGREISREAAWAAATSLRKCFELDGRYDGQERLADGTWLAHVQIPIGRFDG